VNTTVTSVSGTWNSCEIGSMISRKIVKSAEPGGDPGQPLVLCRLLPPRDWRCCFYCHRHALPPLLKTAIEMDALVPQAT
jgi:hypothetical protein